MPGKRRGLSKMTLAYDYFSFHCDFFIGKPPSSSSASSLAASSSSSCFDHDALSYKMQFDDEQMMEAYRVPSHYMTSDAILSPDTVSCQFLHSILALRNTGHASFQTAHSWGFEFLPLTLVCKSTALPTVPPKQLFYQFFDETSVDQY